jgi:hypothetical protein
MRCAVPIALAVCLAGCGKGDPVDNDAKNTAGLPASRENSPNAAGGPPTTRANPAPPSLPGSAPAIPAALQGRWAMAPDDCTSTRGDAKGLLVITPTDLHFYESRAVPGADVDASADSISGSFAFTGEGQTWSKFMALQLQKDGLVRTESNPTASFTYAKCK